MNKENGVETLTNNDKDKANTRGAPGARPPLKLEKI
jgi:hypothetical protein